MTRLHLNQREYDRLLKKQDGMCCVPWCDNSEDLIAEHSTPNAWWPRKPDQLMCRECHKSKTRKDLKAIAQGEAPERRDHEPVRTAQEVRRKTQRSRLRQGLVICGVWRPPACACAIAGCQRDCSDAE